jgi:hypothetical protein
LTSREEEEDGEESVLRKDIARELENREVEEEEEDEEEEEEEEEERMDVPPREKIGADEVEEPMCSMVDGVDEVVVGGDEDGGSAAKEFSDW